MNSSFIIKIISPSERNIYLTRILKIMNDSIRLFKIFDIHQSAHKPTQTNNTPHTHPAKNSDFQTYTPHLFSEFPPTEHTDRMNARTYSFSHTFFFGKVTFFFLSLVPFWIGSVRFRSRYTLEFLLWVLVYNIAFLFDPNYISSGALLKVCGRFIISGRRISSVP